MSKVVLITGSNRGIGYEIAKQCGNLGFYVIISGRDETRLNTALEKLRKEKISADFLKMNVSSIESIEDAVKQFNLKSLNIDVLVNNAGISVNAVCPGWVRTDLGGLAAPRSVEKGAETPVWLTSDAPQDLTGQFLRDKKVISW